MCFASACALCLYTTCLRLELQDIHPSRCRPHPSVSPWHTPASPRVIRPAPVPTLWLQRPSTKECEGVNTPGRQQPLYKCTMYKRGFAPHWAIKGIFTRKNKLFTRG